MSARLEELRAKLAAGTPGPWQIEPGIYLCIATVEREQGGMKAYRGKFPKTIVLEDTEDGSPPDVGDAALIVAAVNALPALLDIAEAAATVIACEPPPDRAVLQIGPMARLRAALDRLNTEDGAGR